jgi:MtN3 and saliva related transmembrane protein
MNLTTMIGLAAALCTTVSYVPQLKKCWETGSADDLSLRMFLILASGITLWVVYGVLQGDAVIILANSMSLVFLAGILYFKLREMCGAGAGTRHPPHDAGAGTEGGRHAATGRRSP